MCRTNGADVDDICKCSKFFFLFLFFASSDLAKPWQRRKEIERKREKRKMKEKKRKKFQKSLKNCKNRQRYRYSAIIGMKDHIAKSSIGL